MFQNKFLISALFFLLPFVGNGQVGSKLEAAYRDFMNDPQLSNAISAIHVVDAETGKTVFSRNAGIGMVPASTQKVITSITAFALLGADYQYETTISYSGSITDGKLNGNLYLKGSGDPSFGSWRYESTKEETILKNIAEVLGRSGIRSISGDLFWYSEGWETQRFPDDWIWQDLGNYYGAGAGAINWRENQYDIMLNSGNSPGDAASVVATRPELYGFTIKSEVKAGSRTSGDNSYIYLPVNGTEAIIRGTIPAGRKAFTVSGAMPNPEFQFLNAMREYLSAMLNWQNTSDPKQASSPVTGKLLYRHRSPSLDSIIYWFNRRSVNLYGEALLKTIAFQEMGEGSSAKGIETIKEFWEMQGIKKEALNMFDGSGLSPMNRVTAEAQVKVILYALQQPWFSSFLESLPEYNNMKMKSGTIRNTKGFAGIHTASNGKEYVFSFLVNNYNGTHSAIVPKMYRVLNALK